jgi:type II secretory pathway component GspD/PulD (secretin)
MPAALAQAFKQTEDIQHRSELQGRITPRVVRHTNQVADLTDQLRYLMSLQ